MKDDFTILFCAAMTAVGAIGIFMGLWYVPS